MWWKICLALVGHQRPQGAELSVAHELIPTILNDCLGIKRVATRLVPKDHLTRLSLCTNFWPKTQRTSLKNQRIHLIWHRSTLFSFQISN